MSVGKGSSVQCVDASGHYLCGECEYEQTLDYLYNRFPMFQKHGTTAYHEGLRNTLLLDEHFQHSHKQYKTVHIGGTNGKGTVATTLAKILETAGYRTGLYTSPHFLDFGERIRIDGEMINRQWLVDFVKREREYFESLQASFFEITTAMAFRYFAEQQVDIAVIEVGLGGRLDCTNVIDPVLSVITNVSLEHTSILGDTVEQIAREKAGIIKAGVPVVVGEMDERALPVIKDRAAELNSPCLIPSALPDIDYLSGKYQHMNVPVIMTCAAQLRDKGFAITPDDISQGFSSVQLIGRWQYLGDNLYCDVGHNPAAVKSLKADLQALAPEYMILSMSADKNVVEMLKTLHTYCPKAHYIFTQSSVPRAMPYRELQQIAAECGITGTAFPTIEEALASRKAKEPTFVGGSCFLIADLLKLFGSQ